MLKNPKTAVYLAIILALVLVVILWFSLLTSFMATGAEPIVVYRCTAVICMTVAAGFGTSIACYALTIKYREQERCEKQRLAEKAAMEHSETLRLFAE